MALQSTNLIIILISVSAVTAINFTRSNSIETKKMLASQTKSNANSIIRAFGVATMTSKNM